MPTINMAYTAPVSDQLIPLITEKVGIFQKYGVNVNVESLPQTEALDSLISGQVQMSVFASPAPEVAQASGTPLKWIATWEDHADLFLMGGPGISTVADLAGRNVAITSPGATTAVLAEVALRAAHVLDKTHLVPVGSVGATLATFLAGSTQSTIAGPPNQTVLMKERPGSKILVDFTKSDPWVGAGVAALTTWTSAHKAETVAVMRGLIAGVAYFRSHPTKVEAIIEQTTGSNSGEANAAYLSTRNIIDETKSLVPVAVTEQQVLAAIRPDYAGASSLKARTVFDTTYIEQALHDGARKNGKKK